MQATRIGEVCLSKFNKWTFPKILTMPLNVQVFSTHPPPHYPSADTKPSSSPATFEKFVLRTFQGRFCILRVYFFSRRAQYEKENEFVSFNLYLNNSNFREKSFIKDLIKTTFGISCFRFAFSLSLFLSYFCLQTNYGYIRGRLLACLCAFGDFCNKQRRRTFTVSFRD